MYLMNASISSNAVSVTVEMRKFMSKPRELFCDLYIMSFADSGIRDVNCDIIQHHSKRPHKQPRQGSLSVFGGPSLEPTVDSTCATACRQTII